MSSYTYQHRAGYGRDDHMADEIIARAMRQLGEDTDGRIAAHVGLASHAVPMGGVSASLPAAPGVRRRMEQALARARREVRSRDCVVVVVCERTVRDGDYLVTEERLGSRWREIDRVFTPRPTR